LYGNGLNVSGGIFHQSPIPQIIKMPLGFTSDQVISNGTTLTLDGRISGNVGITKKGDGTLVLNATNQFTGAFAVQSGTVAVNGVLTNSVLTVINGTLQGTGRVSGPVTILGGATLRPGGEGAGGPMVVDGSLELNGALITRISKTGTNCLSSTVTGVKQLSLGGYLEVQLISGTPSAGDVFRVFNANACSGRFWSVTMPSLSPGLYWDTTALISAGTLTVRQTPPPEIHPLYASAGNVSFEISGSPGASYRVWASIDPAVPESWITISFGSFDDFGNAMFYDWSATYIWDRRFYRISIP
jgi:autotransporter-associated beta strand protein